MRDLIANAAALLGAGVRDHRSLGGGLSRIARITLEDGRRLVAKNGPDPVAEGDMLRAIAATGCPAPRVVASDARVLVIADLEAEAPDDPPSLGAAVARLHTPTGEAYGWKQDYAFSHLPITNPRTGDWPAFFAENRLAPGLESLDAHLAARLERLIATIGDRLPASPPSVLLHGDLWGGNIVGGRNGLLGLVDPACYYGHGEVDLAMMALFGGRLPDTFFADYGDPEPGWRERHAIYQLWPAIVHLKLFGAGYRSMVDERLTASGV